VNIVSGTPPNFEAIVAVFPAAERKGVVFAYGDTVYVNGDATLPAQLVVHESVHLEQQRAMGGPEIWWSRYLVDARFRYQEELVAHRAEYRTLKRISNGLAKKHLRFIAERLSSPLYGSVVTLQQARKAIKAP
jgi:hypothetical protein